MADLDSLLRAEHDEVMLLPAVSGLGKHAPTLRTGVISHPLAPARRPLRLTMETAAQIAMGEAAWRILFKASFFTGWLRRGSTWRSGALATGPATCSLVSIADTTAKLGSLTR